MDTDTLKKQAAATAREIIEKAGLKSGQILVAGCSSSEITGSLIGSDSNYDVAKAVFEGINEVCISHRVFLAAQCCEHLNRAVITERKAVPFAEICNAVPQKKAGGSFAANAYNAFSEPVALEHIKADAGIDIGLTLIGMHLKEVAVPVRLKNNRIGEALVAAARTRPKYIGGERAVYDDDLR